MSGQDGRRPTIHTVAERAGVSKSLVSLVLRGSPKVSEARRRAVLQAIDELGYRPNATARALKESRTKTVGVLLQDLRNPWYLDALDGVNTLLHQHGLRMLLGDQRMDLRNDESLVRGFLEMHLDGLILHGSLTPTDAIIETAAAMPTVALGARNLDLPAVDVVVNDDVTGAGLAVDHLVALGHERIAHVSHTAGVVGRLREQGYRERMAHHGLGRNIVVVDEHNDEDGGYRGVVRLLTGPDRPTAIFVYSDMMALGALSAADDLALRVPEDLSIVGYDNSQLARLRHLSITSVDSASYRVGYRAASRLVERIANPAKPAEMELIEPTLVARGTTAAAPPA